VRDVRERVNPFVSMGKNTLIHGKTPKLAKEGLELLREPGRQGLRSLEDDTEIGRIRDNARKTPRAMKWTDFNHRIVPESRQGNENWDPKEE
jgi:hypothetical protein